MAPGLPLHPPSYKTPEQIAIMRENARLLFNLFESLKPFIVPGSTGIRIQEFCLEYYRRVGMRSLVHGYRDFPAQVCISRNEVAAHGIPDMVSLQAGDLLTVDVAASRRAYCADAAWTFLVPGGSELRKPLLQAAWQASLAGVRAGGQKRRVSAIGQAVQAVVQSQGFSVLARFAGHGLGRHLHEEPHFDFWGLRQADAPLCDGLILNIEPVICLAGAADAQLQKDGWSWSCPKGQDSAQFEFSLVLDDGGWELLNFPPGLSPEAVLPPF